MVGVRLAIPVGDDTAFIIITHKTASIRCSLKTNDPHEEAAAS